MKYGIKTAKYMTVLVNGKESTKQNIYTLYVFSVTTDTCKQTKPNDGHLAPVVGSGRSAN
jgi:hypothetical protein